MKPERLNSFVLLSIENDVLKAVNVDSVIACKALLVKNQEKLA